MLHQLLELVEESHELLLGVGHETRAHFVLGPRGWELPVRELSFEAVELNEHHVPHGMKLHGRVLAAVVRGREGRLGHEVLLAEWEHEKVHALDALELLHVVVGVRATGCVEAL